MTLTILYPEALYPDETVEVALFGPDVRILMRDTAALAELSDEDCARADTTPMSRREFERRRTRHHEHQSASRCC